MSGYKFKSGTWEGFYMLNGKKQPAVLNINFKNSYTGGTIEGDGTDEVLGYFTIHGTYSEKAPYPVEFAFSFSSNSSAKMDFNGWRESDKGGMFGTWKGATGSGTFAFYPSKEASEAAKKLAETGKQQNKAVLLSMGFPDWLIDQALTETKGLEPAVTWITQQLDGSSKPKTQTEEGTEVDPNSLQQLISMGFDEEMAKQALQKTGNAEEAANWLFDRM